MDSTSASDKFPGASGNEKNKFAEEEEKEFVVDKVVEKRTVQGKTE